MFNKYNFPLANLCVTLLGGISIDLCLCQDQKQKNENENVHDRDSVDKLIHYSGNITNY